MLISSSGRSPPGVKTLKARRYTGHAWLVIEPVDLVGAGSSEEGFSSRHVHDQGHGKGGTGGGELNKNAAVVWK
ncbi:hypothetical protein Bpfe_028614 [Biomphalaria pfeifferi]|uniref:Uncharacterized protein n=1 Tax=Biomphalaria pfeifferi TaxID=112525 RepID=A0AAD8AT49_BIOPF|nr:hypothetical protein Bpfe_028614 [Biomphalaria pfeifferi]